MPVSVAAPPVLESVAPPVPTLADCPPLPGLSAPPEPVVVGLPPAPDGPGKSVSPLEQALSRAKASQPWKNFALILVLEFVDIGPKRSALIQVKTRAKNRPALRKVPPDQSRIFTSQNLSSRQQDSRRN